MSAFVASAVCLVEEGPVAGLGISPASHWPCGETGMHGVRRGEEEGNHRCTRMDTDEGADGPASAVTVGDLVTVGWSGAVVGRCRADR